MSQDVIKMLQPYFHFHFYQKLVERQSISRVSAASRSQPPFPLPCEKSPMWYGRKADSCVKQHTLTPVQSHYKSDYSPKINSSVYCRSPALTCIHPVSVVQIILIDIPFTAFPIFTLLSHLSIFNKLQHWEQQSIAHCFALFGRCSTPKKIEPYFFTYVAVIKWIWIYFNIGFSFKII